MRACLKKRELDTPTIATMMPMEIKRWDGCSGTNASTIEGKLTYIQLNSQTPCPPRGAVLVNILGLTMDKMGR
jgi:hypothetical protein